MDKKEELPKHHYFLKRGREVVELFFNKAPPQCDLFINLQFHLSLQTPVRLVCKCKNTIKNI